MKFLKKNTTNIEIHDGGHYYCSFGLDYPAIHTETYDFNDEGIERIVNVNLALIAGE